MKLPKITRRQRQILRHIRSKGNEATLYVDVCGYFVDFSSAHHHFLSKHWTTRPTIERLIDVDLIVCDLKTGLRTPVQLTALAEEMLA